MSLRWTLLLAALLAFILVPFVLWEDQFTRWTDALTNTETGRWLLLVSVVALLAGDIVLPVPSSAVSAAAVAVLGPGPGGMSIWAGMTAGAILGYGLGRTGGAALATRLVGAEDLNRAAGPMQRLGPGVLAVCRAVPVLAEASVLFAGIVAMDPRLFLVTCALANAGVALAYSALAMLGASLGSVYPAMIGAIAIPALAIGIAALTGVRHLRAPRISKKN